MRIRKCGILPQRFSTEFEAIDWRYLGREVAKKPFYALLMADRLALEKTVAERRGKITGSCVDTEYSRRGANVI